MTRVVGEVTLIRDHAGELTTWGQGWGHWADDAMRAHLDQLGDSDSAIDEIVRVVRGVA